MVNELDLWDPFRHMRKMRTRMNDLFSLPEAFTSIRQPLIDVVDKGKSLEIKAELPGIDKKDISINVEDNGLDIRAETKQETRKEKQGYYFHERSNQSYFRRIPLPAEVTAAKTRADFKNGILTISLPKKHPVAKPKGFKVEIK